MEQFLWVEKYRPRTIGECILPDRLKKLFQQYVDSKEIPSLLLSGSPGVGKTTVAKALCNEVGCDFLFINGSDESGIDTFRTKIKQYAGTLSLEGGRKVIIIDEGDYLNPNSTQPALRSAIEEYATNCTFIFTCNYKSRLLPALHSRCASIDFTLQPEEKKEMAMGLFTRLKEILTRENVPFDGKVVAKLVEKHFPDFRKVINELQRYAKGNGAIDSGILQNIKEINVTDLIAAMKEKNFANVRKWANQNSQDTSMIFSKLYASLYEELKPEYIPIAIIKTAEYQYKAAFVADQELNLTACLAEILLECEFK
jgi:DNA polymerase III delta prime subunit